METAEAARGLGLGRVRRPRRQARVHPRGGRRRDRRGRHPRPTGAVLLRLRPEPVRHRGGRIDRVRDPTAPEAAPARGERGAPVPQGPRRAAGTEHRRRVLPVRAGQHERFAAGDGRAAVRLRRLLRAEQPLLPGVRGHRHRAAPAAHRRGRGACRGAARVEAVGGPATRRLVLVRIAVLLGVARPGRGTRLPRHFRLEPRPRIPPPLAPPSKPRTAP